jgi:hypothetical protein
MKSTFNKLSEGVWKINAWIVFHSAFRKCLSIEKIWLSVACTMWFRKKGEYFAGDSEITSLHEHVSHSELLLRYNCLNTHTQLSYIFVCGVGWVAKCARVSWIHETNCSFAFWLLLPAWRHAKADSKNTPTSHRSCRVHCGWRWDFRTFIVKRYKFIISV